MNTTKSFTIIGQLIHCKYKDREDILRVQRVEHCRKFYCLLSNERTRETEKSFGLTWNEKFHGTSYIFKSDITHFSSCDLFFCRFNENQFKLQKIILKEEKGFFLKIPHLPFFTENSVKFHQLDRKVVHYFISI